MADDHQIDVDRGEAERIAHRNGGPIVDNNIVRQIPNRLAAAEQHAPQVPRNPAEMIRNNHPQAEPVGPPEPPELPDLARHPAIPQRQRNNRMNPYAGIPVRAPAAVPILPPRQAPAPAQVYHNNLTRNFHVGHVANIHVQLPFYAPLYPSQLVVNFHRAPPVPAGFPPFPVHSFEIVPGEQFPGLHLNFRFAQMRQERPFGPRTPPEPYPFP